MRRLSELSKSLDSDDLDFIYNQNFQMMELLTQLDDRLCATNEAWEEFDDGMPYFRDTDDVTQEYILEIKHTFRRLRVYQRKINKFKVKFEGSLRQMTQLKEVEAYRICVSRSALRIDWSNTISD